MQAGVFQVLNTKIDLGVPSVITDATILITAPDNTQSGGNASISPDDNTPANPHTLTYLFVPQIAGSYSAVFTFLYGSQSIDKPITFWVMWSDVYSDVRTILNSSSVSDDKIDLEFYSVFNYLKNFTNDCLPDYNNLDSTLRTAFDKGIAYLIAAKIRPTLPGKLPSGEVLLFKKGTTTVQYAAGAKPEFTVEEILWQQGMDLLYSSIPCISVAIDQDNAHDPTMTRGELASGNYHPTGNWTVGSGGNNLGYGEV